MEEIRCLDAEASSRSSLSASQQMVKDLWGISVLGGELGGCQESKAFRSPLLPNETCNARLKQTRYGVLKEEEHAEPVTVHL